MSGKTTRLLLSICAVIGSLMAFLFIKTYIIDISFSQYVFIEIILTLSHAVYNYTKKHALENIQS
jgi:VIT1/CCC1 family predicted Fe2+/Mn2+ transporter